MRFRSSKTIKLEFLAGRREQHAAEFLARCDVTITQNDTALNVREAIANLAGVNACFIHAGDSFDRDLAHFDFWSSLDSMAVILELEKCLEVRISESQAQMLPNPESIPGFTVAEFVKQVLQVIAKK